MLNLCLLLYGKIQGWAGCVQVVERVKQIVLKSFSNYVTTDIINDVGQYVVGATTVGLPLCLCYLERRLEQTPENGKGSLGLLGLKRKVQVHCTKVGLKGRLHTSSAFQLLGFWITQGREQISEGWTFI